MILAGVFGGMAAVPARADSIIVMGISKHFQSDVSHQERNWGLGYQTGRFMVGAYRNSFNDPAAYALYQLVKYDVTDRVTLSLPVGGALGYKKTPVMPVALPTISYRFAKHLTVDAFYIPGGGDNKGIAGAQLRIDLGAFR